MGKPSSTREVNKAIAALRSLHQSGRTSLKENPPLPPTGASPKRNLGVTATGSHEITAPIRCARELADRYSDDELNDLCLSCREDHFAPGLSKITRLMSVKDKRRRMIVQKKMIKGRLSHAQLILEIRKYHDRRSHGGRPMLVPKDNLEAYIQIERHCQRWGRMSARLGVGSKPATARQHLSLELGRTVRQHLKQADEVMRQLEDAVGTALNKPRIHPAGAKPSQPGHRK